MSDATRFQLRHDRAVQAGAGTGKTHALVTQYLHLCAGLTAHTRPLEPRQIAAMTFTEKAAGEMLERIRQRVARLVLAFAEGDRAVALAEPELWRTAQALERPVPAASHWERTLAQLGAAQVGTFHSFAAGLLRRHPALSGVDPDFALLDQDSATALAIEATERAILSALEGAQGRDTGPKDASLLLAEYGFRGVGGGEALVELLCRVRARRAEEGLGSDRLAAGYSEDAIAIGFERARGQILEALRRLGELAELLGDKSSGLARELSTLGTMLAQRLLTLTDVPVALPLLDPALATLGRLRGRKDDEGGQRALAEVKALLRLGQKDLEAAHYTFLAAPLAGAFERLLGEAIRGYDEAKRRLGALDFTDLLSRARDLLRDHGAARAQLRDRFAAVLVDECQDTNPLQAEILVLLCGEPRAREPGPGRLYIVGDRKQSIYEFRGADVATFQALQQAIVEGGGDEETLAVSRRSRPGVLQLANALFAQVMQVPPGGFLLDSSSAATPIPILAPAGGWPAWIVTWDSARDPLLPLREDGDDEPAAELLTREEDAADAEADDAIGIEAQLVARHILSLREAGRPFSDMAMLLSRFTHLERYLFSLRQAAIPYYVVKGRGFYQAQEIRDLGAVLTLVDDPEDTLALVSVLRSPLCGLSDDSLTRLHLTGALSLSALSRRETGAPIALEIPAPEAARLHLAIELLSGLAARGDRLGPSGCLRAIYDATDLLPVLLAGPEGEQRVANLQLLLSRAQQFEDGGGSLRAFIRWLRLLCDPALSGEALSPQAQIVSEGDDVVRVMTVHQAKGLEFPVVFIPGCTARERIDTSAVGYERDIGVGLSLRRGGERKDTLPSLQIQKLRRLRAEAEAARLFYVAVTRARDRVIFVGEGRRSKGTWRGHLDALLASQASPVLAVRRMALGLTAPSPTAPEAAFDPALPVRDASTQLVARLYDPSPCIAPVELSPAAAIDLSLCPRRFRLRHALLLAEATQGGEPALPIAAEEERAESDRLRTGTLAHRLLRRADLTAGGADLEGLLRADGVDPQDPRAAEIRTRVARLLKSRYFLEVVLPARPQRALPYRLAVGPTLTLRGQMDLLFTDAAGTITLLDYRYGYLPQAREAEDLRRAVLSHILRALSPPGAALQVGLVYLREPDPSPLLEICDPPKEQVALLALTRAAPLAARGDQEALAEPPLPLSRCRALGCGYQYRCHGR